jgi:hypothetical protein
MNNDKFDVGMIDSICVPYGATIDNAIMIRKVDGVV